MTEFQRISLSAIGDGKAVDQFNYELKRVVENCLDINTDPTFERVVTLKVKIKPNQERDKAAIEFQATSKIAPDVAGTDLVHFGRDGAFVSSAKQLTFEDYEKDVAELEAAQGGSNDQSSD